MKDFVSGKDGCKSNAKKLEKQKKKTTLIQLEFFVLFSPEIRPPVGHLA